MFQRNYRLRFKGVSGTTQSCPEKDIVYFLKCVNIMKSSSDALDGTPSPDLGRVVGGERTSWQWYQNRRSLECSIARMARSPARVLKALDHSSLHCARKSTPHHQKHFDFFGWRHVRTHRHGLTMHIPFPTPLKRNRIKTKQIHATDIGEQCRAQRTHFWNNMQLITTMSNSR